MATKKAFLENHDEKKDSDDKCPYAEAGKTILGDTSFHGLPWITENIPVILKVGRIEKYVDNVIFSGNDWSLLHHYVLHYFWICS